jgi:hypothetical protein
MKGDGLEASMMQMADGRRQMADGRGRKGFLFPGVQAEDMQFAEMSMLRYPTRLSNDPIVIIGWGRNGLQGMEGRANGQIVNTNSDELGNVEFWIVDVNMGLRKHNAAEGADSIRNLCI